jgi:protein dithiol:quinone oxidoreductase
MPTLSARTAFAFVAAASLAALAGALVAQHGYDMQPCAWCVLQRLVYAALAAVALLGLLLPAARGRLGGRHAGPSWAQRVAAALLLLLCTAGVAAALWQHFVAASAQSCDLSMAERIVSATRLDAWLPDVFTAWASCKDAAVKLAGLPFEVWSLLLYLLLAASVVMALRARR